MEALTLRVDVPLTSLRPFTARDYQETLPAPPPATVFGMLLSLAGVDGKEVDSFIGSRIGIAIEEEPSISTVLRKMRRDAASSEETKQGIPQFRPEYQELLSGLRFWVAIAESVNSGADLAGRVRSSLERPSSVDRYGGVSLGESAFLVDSVSLVSQPPDDALVLRPNQEGFLSMALWTDFHNRSRTRLGRFELVRGQIQPNDLVRIAPAA